MPTKWRTYDKDTVATRLDRSELPGFFRKLVSVGPGEAALVLKNGSVEQVLTESGAKVADTWDKICSWFGVAKDLEVIFVDISPYEIPIYLGNRTTEDRGTITQSVNTADETRTTHTADAADVVLVALSKDREVITAECRVRLRVCLEDATRFAALLRGQNSLAIWDLAAMVRGQLVGPVLQPLIAAHNADEFRASSGIRDQIAAEVKQKVGEGLASWGLTLDSFSLAWGLTETEKAQIAAKRVQREEEVRTFLHRRALLEMQREQELQKTRLANWQELRMAELHGDSEVKDFLQRSEIDRDLTKLGATVDVARIDAEIRGIQLDLERRESQMRLEQRRQEELVRLEIEEREFKQRNVARAAELELEDKEMASMVRMQIQMATSAHDRDMAKRRQELDADMRRQQQQIEAQYQERKARLDEDLARIAMQERILSQAIAKGAVASSDLKDTLQSLSEAGWQTATDDKVRARAEADAAKHNLETFKHAEDRERQQQAHLTRLSTDMMERAKQSPAPTVVVPGGGAALPFAGAPVNIVNVPASQPGVAASASGRGCVKCGTLLQAGWKVCVECGTPVAGPPLCNRCHKPIEPTWKVCAHCGNPI